MLRTATLTSSQRLTSKQLPDLLFARFSKCAFQKHASSRCSKCTVLLQWRQQLRSVSTIPDASHHHSTDTPVKEGEKSWDDLFESLPSHPPSTSATQSRTGRLRRQTMTAREIGVFDEMFNMIFDSINDKKQQSTEHQPQQEQHQQDIVQTDDEDPTKSGLAIRKGTVSDFFGKLRSQSLRSLWTPASYEELDEKKEAMNLCDTDQQLLEWAMQEVFGESEKYLQNAIQAMKDNNINNTTNPLPMLQPPTYPYIVALLMRTFRVKYSDPHLALSIFNHARHLSAASYVFGCSTQAYNELIETRWTCFHDLRGVHDALEEMNVNGVLVDAQTRKLAETVRRQVGSRNVWAEENEMGSGEVIALLDQIDKFVGNAAVEGDSASSDASGVSRIDSWKYGEMKDREDDQFGFDKWDTRSSLRGGARPWGAQKM